MNYPNPVISGFHPDPSVVRVGDDFYIATSTFEYLPGIPIFHSTDFVTWTQIGNVATRPGQLAPEKVITGGGAWAPTIRHRDGVFHLIITEAMGRGMVHFTATDPAGPWSDGADLAIDGIDPDLAWDSEGTAYVTYSALSLDFAAGMSHGGIQQVRVDLDTHTVLSEPIQLWSGTGLQFPESPHLYEIDGYWYLLIAEGGTERGHGVSIARGPGPEGPFEGAPGNPLLSARSTIRPVQNTGHGDLVIGPDGEWLIVLLGVRPQGMSRAFSPLGRETFVTSLRWVDGWPMFEPVEANPRPGFGWREDFDGELGPEWLAIRRVPAAVADLDSRPGHLVLTADGSTLVDPQPVFLGRVQQHPFASATAQFDVENGVGGLVVRYDEKTYYSITAGAGSVVARAQVPGIAQEWSIPFAGSELQLELTSRVPESGGTINAASDLVDFAATIDGVRTVLASVDGRYLSSETAFSFTGRVIGAFAIEGTVAIDWVEYTGTDS